MTQWLLNQNVCFQSCTSLIADCKPFILTRESHPQAHLSALSRMRADPTQIPRSPERDPVAREDGEATLSLGYTQLGSWPPVFLGDHYYCHAIVTIIDLDFSFTASWFLGVSAQTVEPCLSEDV